MRNLTKPSQYEDARGSSFEAGCEGLVLFTPAGERVRLHVGADGFLYINGHPFGVAGMPPALHAAMHAAGGGDAVTPAAIGAVPALAVGVSVAPLEGGKVPPVYLEGLIAPRVHAGSHMTGGSDPLNAVEIGGVSATDPRLSNARMPMPHAASHHLVGGNDPIDPASIGAVSLGDQRLTDRRTPIEHASTHYKNGPDALSWEDVGAVDAGILTVRDRVPHGVPQLNDLGHIDVNLLPEFALRPAKHADTHAADGIDAVTPLSILAADRQHQHADADILSVDASKIISGTIDLDRLPAAAMERLVPVVDLADMYKLTIADVQNGDVVQALDTGLMYRVVDDTVLESPNGYRVFTAGMAAAVPWSGVQNKPTDFNPTAHSVRHAVGGIDALTPAAIGAPTLVELSTVSVLAQKGVNDAANATFLANTAQVAANKGIADAAAALGAANAANANANTRATQAALDALTGRVAALEQNAVTSTNIRSISGTALTDGVGTLQYQPK